MVPYRELKKLCAIGTGPTEVRIWHKADRRLKQTLASPVYSAACRGGSTSASSRVSNSAAGKGLLKRKPWIALQR